VDAVDEDGMSSPEDGGAAAGGLSELATIAGAENSIETAGGEGRPNALRRIGRYAACAAIFGVVLGLGTHLVLQFAMAQLGPPPLQTVSHLLPTWAPSEADQKQEATPVALSPEQVDPRYLRMLFAFEDRRFYSHYGVDPFGIVRAARDLVWKQRIVTGGSTLTMQVARLLDNQYKRTASVKLRQIVRAFQLEQQLTKKEILSLYLGLAPFGGRVKGVRAASLKYFGKEPQNLTDAEAALLVALPQAPEARRLDRDAKAALRARNFVLRTVTAAGVLTPEEAQRAQLEPVAAASTPMPPNPEMKPVMKPATANVAGLFAGITLGINFVAGPAAAEPVAPIPNDYFLTSSQPLVLDVREKLLKTLPEGTTQADRDALWMYYAGRSEPVWVGKTGFKPNAEAVIAEIKRAGDWGLDAAAFDIPPAPDSSEKARAEAELGLSLGVLKYARYARGGRIEDPATQLSSYLDRKPQLRPPFLIMTDIAASDAPDAYLRKMNPQSEQFERLRQQYLARRDGSPHQAVVIPTKGSKIYPGSTNEDIALIRERLHVPIFNGEPERYDDALVETVKAFQMKRDISPANGIINAKTRRAFNEGKEVSASTLLANMEEWRWMPQDLGETHVMVNIPEYMVRVINNGQVVHSERVIVGELDKQTPVFSQDLETIYFHPRWNVPESIKVKEILPSLARGGGYFHRQGMKLVRNGREIKSSSVNWGKADIRNYDVYQPSGPGNALGLMKFTFPNKHSVYMHDTQSKGLFSSTERTFSHGCVRVKNPQRLAEVLLGIDKGWKPEYVAALLKGDPEENGVPLNHHIPVHITYFTAQVDADGEVTTEEDVYGHEKRITQALQGKWDSIKKGSDHLAQVEMAQRFDDSERFGRAKVRRSGGSRRVVSRSYGGGGGGSPQRIVSRGNSANDIFRQSFGY
jgi:murein L,D-transpeptidase YcbB/YkuD